MKDIIIVGITDLTDGGSNELIVVISPATTTRFDFTRVSQATRLVGS
jgi:hypothetical protein